MVKRKFRRVVMAAAACGPEAQICRGYNIRTAAVVVTELAATSMVLSEIAGCRVLEGRCRGCIKDADSEDQ